MKIGIGSASGSLAAILAAFLGAPLAAGTASGTMTVTAIVEESCSLDARPMAFGTVRSGSSHVDAQSSLTVACTPDAVYVVTIDEGQQAANGTRRMASVQGRGFLEYDIFRDAARTQRWGASPATSLSGIAPASGTVSYPIYGRTTAGDAVAGSYGDVVTVMITF